MLKHSAKKKNIKRRCVYDTVSKNPNQKIIKRKLLGYLIVNYLIIQSNDTLPILEVFFFNLKFEFYINFGELQNFYFCFSKIFINYQQLEYRSNCNFGLIFTNHLRTSKYKNSVYGWVISGKFQTLIRVFHFRLNGK